MSDPQGSPSEPPPRRISGRSIAIRVVLGLGISGLLLGILLRYIDLSDIGRTLGSLGWKHYLAGLGVWVLLYLLRTLRFLLLAPGTPFMTMAAIASVHNFLLRLLPMRSGELSFGFLVRRAGTASLGKSLLGLLLVRGLDATTVVLLFGAVLLLGSGYRVTGAGIAAAVVLGVLGLLVVLKFCSLLRLGLAMLRAVGRALRLTEKLWFVRISCGVERSIGEIDAMSRGTVWWLAGISLVIWLVMFWAFFVIMHGFQIPVSFSETIVGSSAAVAASFLPISGIGMFGTHETGWALGFVWVGLPQQQAIASGFSVALITLSYAALLGALGWLVLIARRRKA